VVKLDVLEHVLVPKHEILGQEEADEMLKRFKIDMGKLPKIKEKDPTVMAIGGKNGDIIKIIRSSPTAGTAVIYRLVIE